MMTGMDRRAAAIVVLVALLAAACSGGSDGSSEGPGFGDSGDEGGSGDGSDGSGDADSDDDVVTLETEDGSVSVGSQTLPDRLEFAVPAGGEVVSVLEFDDDLAVVLSYPIDDFDSVVAFFDGELETDAGFERSENEFESADGISIRTIIWLHADGDRTVNVTNCPDLGGGDSRATCVALAHP